MSAMEYKFDNKISLFWITVTFIASMIRFSDEQRIALLSKMLEGNDDLLFRLKREFVVLLELTFAKQIQL